VTKDRIDHLHLFTVGKPGVDGQADEAVADHVGHRAIVLQPAQPSTFWARVKAHVVVV